MRASLSLSSVLLLLLLLLPLLLLFPGVLPPVVSFVLESLSLASFPASRAALPSLGFGGGAEELEWAWCARGGGAMMFVALADRGFGFEVCRACVLDAPWDFDGAAFEAVVLLLPPPPPLFVTLLASLLLLLVLELLLPPPGMKERRFSDAVDIRPSFLSFVMGTSGNKTQVAVLLLLMHVLVGKRFELRTRRVQDDTTSPAPLPRSVREVSLLVPALRGPVLRVTETCPGACLREAKGAWNLLLKESGRSSLSPSSRSGQSGSPLLGSGAIQGGWVVRQGNGGNDLGARRGCADWGSLGLGVRT